MRCSECVYGVRTGAGLFCAEYDFLIECEDANGCKSYEPIRKPRTNGDRVRSMSDEDMAEWLALKGCYHCDARSVCIDRFPVGTCRAAIMEWLKQEEGREK